MRRGPHLPVRVALPELDVPDLLDLDDAVPGEDPSGVALVAVLADRRLHHVGDVVELGVLAQDVDQDGRLRRGRGRGLPDHRRVPRHQLLQSLDQLVPVNTKEDAIMYSSLLCMVVEC